MDESCHTYECVMSCYAYKWVMSQICAVTRTLSCQYILMRCDSLICVTWLTHMCDMSQSCVHAMTSSYMWHDSFMSVELHVIWATGTPLTQLKNRVEFWELPWKCVWCVWGLPWKLVEYFGCRNYDLLRLGLQHTATYCSILQHTATHCNTLQHTISSVWDCNTLQHTAAHCNTLQHTATHCSTRSPPSVDMTS